MLKRIYIHNYKTFVNFEWSPPRVCALVGENGAGKTAFIEILWTVRQLVVEGKQIYETALPSSRTAWLMETEQIVELEIDYEGCRFLYRLECLHGVQEHEMRERLTVDNVDLYRSGDGKVELLWDDPSLAALTIPCERRRSFIAGLESAHYDRRDCPNFYDLRLGLIMSFRTAIESIWRLKPAVGLSNFAEWYRAKVQEDPEAAAALQVDLRDALIGFAQLRLGARELRVRFDFGKTTHELPWSALSEGQKFLIVLYGFLRSATKRAALLVLEEIENYIALSEIQPWLRRVVDVMAANNGQLIVISHHPESIDYLAADAVWVMSRDRLGGHTRISPLEPDLDAGETASAALMSGAHRDDLTARSGQAIAEPKINLL